MYHATAISSSYEVLLDPLAELFGCRVLHLDSSDVSGVERRGGMTWIGDNSIELGEPFGAGSPAHRFVERFGGGMHSFAVQVPDLDQALERARTFGVEVAHYISPEIAFTRPGSTAGLLIEWSSHYQGDDPRWGAPVPAFERPPVLQPTALAFVGAVVADPVADARLLADILDTEVTVLADGGPADLPWAAVSLGDCSLAFYPLPAPEDSVAIWGQVHLRPRCVSLGLTVDDVASSLSMLGEVGVQATHHCGADTVILGGLSIPVVLSSSLLAGDPRLVGGRP